MTDAADALAASIAETLMLGPALERLRDAVGGYDLVEHAQQGEFHHDVLVRVPGDRWLVIATNCNAGIKEVLVFGERPSIDAVWRWRCPDNPEFAGALPAITGRATTPHWFDPCALLGDDARSELRPEHRERQRGGGWVCARRPSDGDR
jgi:hypothetical protein